MSIPSCDDIFSAARTAFEQLCVDDGCLFELPIEGDDSCDARKLHEVCINHKLAEKLSSHLLPLVNGLGAMFVDIEFNREGIHFKELTIDGQKKTVRPDIIIHNRRSDSQKLNLLVVECKKEGCSTEESDYDELKIRSFMTDGRYEYHYGLRVTYGSSGINADLFFRSDSGIINTRSITCPTQIPLTPIVSVSPHPLTPLPDQHAPQTMREPARP